MPYIHASHRTPPCTDFQRLDHALTKGGVSAPKRVSLAQSRREVSTKVPFWCWRPLRQGTIELVENQYGGWGGGGMVSCVIFGNARRIETRAIAAVTAPTGLAGLAEVCTGKVKVVFSVKRLQTDTFHISSAHVGSSRH